jgi:glucokinase
VKDQAAGGDVAVLEIGGTHVSAALVQPASWEVRPESLRRHPLVASASADRLIGDLVAAADGLGARPGTRWGVATPGPFDLAGGIGWFRDVGKFDALYGVDLRGALLAGIKAAPASVAFIDDAEAFVVGEWLVGATQGAQRCAGITIGTGIGSGFLADGQLVRHRRDVPPQGRVHFLTIDGVPLEDVISRRAILRSYGELAGPRPDIDVKDVAEAARAGDSAARQVFDHAFTALGSALAPWLVAFRAEQLVVGGSISTSWDLVEPPLTAALAAGGAGTVTVVAGVHPDTSPVVGAAWTATRPVTG